MIFTVALNTTIIDSENPIGDSYGYTPITLAMEFVFGFVLLFSTPVPVLTARLSRDYITTIPALLVANLAPFLRAIARFYASSKLRDPLGVAPVLIGVLDLFRAGFILISLGVIISDAQNDPEKTSE